MIHWIIHGVSLLLIVGLSFVLFRCARRLLQFDDLFQLLEDDVHTNTRYLNKLLGTATFDNSPEIQEAQKNMRIIEKRLQEFVNRFRDARRKDTKE